MNAIQKEQIAQMKIQGNSYSQISNKLGIPTSTIKSFCRRNSLCAENTSATRSNENICKHCGKRLKHIIGHKKKKYCSDKCRMAYWNTHQDDVNRKAVYKFICPICGIQFESYGNKNRIYCSLTCFGKSRRDINE